ncbi:MAG: hypothetical protein KA099_12750 [Alphaproteobacteria bacterium]|nr:hypothetical protein [Alphaproteobacteria bacterium]MDD4092439.1 hypothetical protein [Smithellaceae bacterium]HOF42068.1 hypothetical protein [Candidatus Hydrogenedentota bacterium]
MRKEKPPVTLQDIEDCIEEWEESLRWIALPDYEEFDYDVSKREYLDDALWEYGDQPLPKELTDRIFRADQRFRELTKESAHCVFSNYRKYDRERYWYYYRSLR